MIPDHREIPFSQASNNAPHLAWSYNSNSDKKTDMEIHSKYSNEKEEKENVITMYFKRSICRKQVALRLMLSIESLDTWLATKVQQDIKKLNAQLNKIQYHYPSLLDNKRCSTDLKQSFHGYSINNSSKGLDFNTSQRFSSSFGNFENNNNDLKIQDQQFTEEEENAISLYYQRKITESVLAKLCRVPIESLNKWLMENIRINAENLQVKFDKIVSNFSISNDKSAADANELFQPQNYSTSRSSLKLRSASETSPKKSQPYCFPEDEKENAIRLYYNGFITSKQLALFLNIPIASLDSWLIVKIQEDVKKLSKILQNIFTSSNSQFHENALTNLPISMENDCLDINLYNYKSSQSSESVIISEDETNENIENTYNEYGSNGDNYSNLKILQSIPSTKSPFGKSMNNLRIVSFKNIVPDDINPSFDPKKGNIKNYSNLQILRNIPSTKSPFGASINKNINNNIRYASALYKDHFAPEDFSTQQKSLEKLTTSQSTTIPRNEFVEEKKQICEDDITSEDSKTLDVNDHVEEKQLNYNVYHQDDMTVEETEILPVNDHVQEKKLNYNVFHQDDMTVEETEILPADECAQEKQLNYNVYHQDDMIVEETETLPVNVQVVEKHLNYIETLLGNESVKDSHQNYELHQDNFIHEEKQTLPVNIHVVEKHLNYLETLLQNKSDKKSQHDYELYQDNFTHEETESLPVNKNFKEKQTKYLETQLDNESVKESQQNYEFYQDNFTHEDTDTMFTDETVEEDSQNYKIFTQDGIVVEKIDSFLSVEYIEEKEQNYELTDEDINSFEETKQQPSVRWETPTFFTENTSKSYTEADKEGALALFKLYNQNVYDHHSATLHHQTISTFSQNEDSSNDSHNVPQCFNASLSVKSSSSSDSSSCSSRSSSSDSSSSGSSSSSTSSRSRSSSKSSSRSRSNSSSSDASCSSSSSSSSSKSTPQSLKKCSSSESFSIPNSAISKIWSPVLQKNISFDLDKEECIMEKPCGSIEKDSNQEKSVDLDEADRDKEKPSDIDAANGDNEKSSYRMEEGSCKENSFEEDCYLQEKFFVDNREVIAKEKSVDSRKKNSSKSIKKKTMLRDRQYTVEQKEDRNQSIKKKTWPRGKQYSDEHKEKMVALYRDTDISLRALSRQSGIASETLKKWMTGLETKYKRRKYSASERKRALEFYRKGNFSIEAAAQKLGILRATLNHWIVKTNSKKIISKYSLEQKKEALELYNQGNITQVEVARKLKVPRSIIRQWVHEKDYWTNGVKPDKVMRKYTEEDRQRVLELYRQGNITQNEIGRQLKIPRGTVHNWVHQKEYWANETKPLKADQKYYPAEVRKRALELYNEGNVSQNEVARQIKIPRPTLQLWINNEKQEKRKKTNRATRKKKNNSN